MIHKVCMLLLIVKTFVDSEAFVGSEDFIWLESKSLIARLKSVCTSLSSADF